MKKLILTIAVGITVAQAQAQISIAPEVGVNLSNASVSTNIFGNNAIDTKMKPGLKAGAVVDIPIVGGLFVQPGAFFSMKGYKVTSSATVLGITTETKGTSALNYLEIPVNLGYRYTISDAGSVFVTAGPYLGYAFSGKVKQKSTVNGNTVTDTETDIDFGSDDTEMKPLDFGLNFSAGYQLPMGLYVRAQYGLGLSDLSNTNLASHKNRVLAFSLGYAFRLGGK
jgi:hypothetical protein